MPGKRGRLERHTAGGGRVRVRERRLVFAVVLLVVAAFVLADVLADVAFRPERTGRSTQDRAGNRQGQA